MEDNDLNREIARELLKMKGFFVEEARDGTDAVEKVSNSVACLYDLVDIISDFPVQVVKLL